MIAAPVSLVAGWPMKRSVPSLRCRCSPGRVAVDRRLRPARSSRRRAGQGRAARAYASTVSSSLAPPGSSSVCRSRWRRRGGLRPGRARPCRTARSASRDRILRFLRTPAASASRSSDRAISLAATPVSLARILSSSFSRSLTSAPSLVRPGRRGSRSGSSSGSSGLACVDRRDQPGADIVGPPPADRPRTRPRSSWFLGG